MDTTAAQNTPDGYSISVSGSFTFNTTCKIRQSAEMSDTGIGNDVTSGQTIDYTGKEKNDNHFWITYTGVDGSTLYIPYANITSGVVFGTDSNPTDPVQSSDNGGSGDNGGNNDSGGNNDGGNTPSVDPDALGAKFQLLNLPIPQAAQKCFAVFDNTAYVVQINQGSSVPGINDVYIAKGAIDQNAGTITFDSDYMILEGFGHCQTLDYYQYNGQVYLWIALDGKQKDKKGNYWGTQLGRIQYTPGQTISSYTEVTRLANLINANQSGRDVGTLKRVETAVSEDSNSMVVMDITTDDQVYLTYYDFMALNSQMDSHEGTYLSCEDITSLAHDWGSSTSLSSLLPLSQSVQGLAMDADHNVYISSGQAGASQKVDDDPAKDGAWIAKSAWGGTFNQQAVSASSEKASDWAGLGSAVEIEGIQLYYGNVNATVTKHFKSDPDKSYIYQFPEAQF